MLKTRKMSRRQVVAGLATLPTLAGCSGVELDRTPFGNSPVSQGANVVALLPISGRNAALGEQMAKAVWLGQDTGALPGQTTVFDSGDTPEAAGQAAQRALAQGATAIVGPLSRGQTPAVLAVAGDVPVITLSNDRALASQGAWVFGVTPKQSADAVLRYARASKLTSIAIIDQQDPIAQRASAALQEGARAAKLRAVSSVPVSTSPGELASTLRGLNDGTLPDILYVPSDGPAAQAQAVAAVKAGVATIGSLQWSGLSQDAFRRLDKACYTGPDPIAFNRAAELYRQSLGEELGVIAALAVDAVAFAHARPTLASREPVQGLLGATEFSQDRTLTRDLAVLRINNGGVERVA